MDVLLEDRLAGRRRDERLVQVTVDVVERLDAEHAALPAAVRRLQHRREPTSSPARRVSDSVRTAAKRGCGTPASASAPPHRDLVRHQVRRLGPDPRQAARLGDRRDDRHRAVGRYRQHAVDPQPRGRLQHRLDVGEVDDLRDVRLREPWRVGIPVDGRDSKAQLLRPENRAALVAACTDEENGPHGRRILLRRDRRPE